MKKELQDELDKDLMFIEKAVEIADGKASTEADFLMEMAELAEKYLRRFKMAENGRRKAMSNIEKKNVKKTEYKHITKVEGVCGGRSIIGGTRHETEWVRHMLLSQPRESAYKELMKDYGLTKEQIDEVERYYGLVGLKVIRSFSYNHSTLAILIEDESGERKIKYRNNECLSLEASRGLAYWELSILDDEEELTNE